MKKTFLGQVIFILACVFTILFIFVKIYTAWMIGVRFEGWNNIIDMSLAMGGYSIVKMISEYFVVPIVCCIVCLVYVFKIGRNKIINRWIYVVTAMAIFVEMLFYTLSNINSYYNAVPILPLLLRIGFFLSFVLLFTGCSKQFLQKILYVLLSCSVVGTAIYLIGFYKHNLPAIMQNAETMQDVEIICMYSEYFIFPILGLIVIGGLICYILFPEKFLKSAN